MHGLTTVSLRLALLLALTLSGASMGETGVPGVTTSPPPSFATAAASYHYGEKFAAAVRRFQETPQETVRLAVAPASAEQQQQSEQEQEPEQPWSITREQRRDMMKSVSLAGTASKQMQAGYLFAARQTALECLKLMVRHHTCFIIFLHASSDLGLHSNAKGGLHRSRAVLDVSVQWFAVRHRAETVGGAEGGEHTPFRPFPNDITFPQSPDEYRQVFHYYILSVLSLGMSEAHLAVYGAIRNITRWRHPFQICHGQTFVERLELEGGPAAMPRPFWPASDFPHVKKVLEEEVYLALLEELPLVPESMWVEHAEVNLKSGEASRWQEIRLCEMDDFMWSKKRCEMLPKTCAVLQRNGLFAQRLIPYHPNTDANSGGAADNDPIFSGVPGRLSLLRLSPKSALVPHSGPNNVRISFHMGVLLPPPVEIAPGVSSFTESATITVANHTVRWQRGKVMFWDDSFVHSVRNDHPTEPRVVFTGHLFKPAITSGSVGGLYGMRWKLDETRDFEPAVKEPQEYGAAHEYGELDDEWETDKGRRRGPRLPDEDAFVGSGGCRMRDGVAEFRAVESAAASEAKAGAPSSFLDTLVYFVEHTLNASDVPMLVAGETEWMATWAENAEGPDARPFTATGVVPWWRLEGDSFADDADDADEADDADKTAADAQTESLHMKEFSCAELARVFGHLRANYQDHSGGALPGSPEDLVQKFTDDGFQLRTIGKRIPSCAVNKTETQQQQQQQQLLEQVMGREKVGEDVPVPVPSWFKTNSSRSSAVQLHRDLHHAGFGQRTPTYLMGTRFNLGRGELLRRLYSKGILTEVAEFVDGVDRTEDKFYRASLHDFASRSQFAGDQHYLRAQQASQSNDLQSVVTDGHASTPFLKLPRGLTLDEVFVYIGDKFSGTFLHDHGSVCLMASTATESSSKLWILYPPHSSFSSPQYCTLNGSLPSHLPKFCAADARFKEKDCIEDLHSLDLLQHYWELRALGSAPLLHIQKPGEVFCLPEGWYHATVNLGPSMSIALKLHRQVRSFVCLSVCLHCFFLSFFLSFCFARVTFGT